MRFDAHANHRRNARSACSPNCQHEVLASWSSAADQNHFNEVWYGDQTQGLVHGVPLCDSELSVLIAGVLGVLRVQQMAVGHHLRVNWFRSKGLQFLCPVA